MHARTSLRWTRLLAIFAALALVLAACGDDDDSDGGAVDGPTIKIGAQDFGESAILSEVYGQALAAAGYDVDQVSIGGYRDVLLDAFAGGEVNFSAEYAASMVNFIAGEGASGDVDATVENLQTALDDLGLQALEPSSAVDTNAFVVTAETAEELDLAAISDLPADGAGIVLGASADCETNEFCLPGLTEVYGIDLSDGFTPLASDLLFTALTEGEINVGVLFSTDARIATEGLVLLEDDQNMLAADNVTPVLSDDVIDAYGDDLAALIDEISAALTTENLTAMNERFQVDKEDADAIAADFLAENDLL